MTIKAIGFDLGGILYDVDYHRVIAAFQKLGANDPEKIFTQKEQAGEVSQYECGQIDTETFVDYLRHTLAITASDAEIETACNAMPLGFRFEKVEVVRSYRESGFVTFLFSNINDLHYRYIVNELAQQGALEKFNDAFDALYYSHLLGAHKPDRLSFEIITKELFERYAIKPAEILFIDDTHKHIYGRTENEGAIAAGMQGLLLEQNLSVDGLVKTIDGELHRLKNEAVLVQ